VIVTKRVSVTLVNGRAHVLRLPDGVDAQAAAQVLFGLRSGSEVGWPDGDGDWLPFDEGDGRLRRDTIAEVSVVDWVESPTEIYG
jgi:hypothetical protein